MRSPLLRALRSLCVASAAFVFAGCAGATTGAIGGSSAPNVAAPQGQATILNDSGQFSGTAKDSVLGQGSASASLAQDARVVGGVLTTTFGSTTLSNSLAAKTTTGATLTGAEAASTTSGICTFTVSATYDPSKYVLSGTYQAAHGCTGETGSFKIKQDCFYPPSALFGATPAFNGVAKPNHGPRPC